MKMAKDKKSNENQTKGPNTQGSENKSERKHGLLFGIFALVTALVIIAVVLGGAFYIVIHNNVNGLAVRYRKQIESLPVLKLALPKNLDYEDLKYLTAEELRAKYHELRTVRDELESKLREAEVKIGELQKYKDEEDTRKSELEKAGEDIKKRQDELDAKIKQYEEDKKKLDELIISDDKEGFKAFYEKIDKKNAEELYAQVLKDERTSEEIKSMAKIFENMDPASAAKIFEQMGSSKIELIAEMLSSMNKEAAAGILGATSPSLASKVAEYYSVKKQD